MNSATLSGATPAYAAAVCGHAAILKMLHGEGADLVVADKNGVTPLHAAVYHRHAEVVDYLLQVIPNHLYLQLVFFFSLSFSLALTSFRKFFLFQRVLLLRSLDSLR